MCNDNSLFYFTRGYSIFNSSINLGYFCDDNINKCIKKEKNIEMAGPRKLSNIFRHMKFPIRTYKNKKTKRWSLVDKENIIIAENMTQNDAETNRDAVNYIGKAILFLIDLLNSESLVEPCANVNPNNVIKRELLLAAIYEFLIDTKTFEEPEPESEPELDVKPTFEEWKTNLSEDLLKVVENIEPWGHEENLNRGVK